jgi:hypothetical protein
MDRVYTLYHAAMRMIDRMDMQQWLMVLIGVVIIGLICMRGFGSRSSY